MKLVSSLLLLAMSTMMTSAATATATDRELQIADWHVSLLTVNAQDFTFETGTGGGDNPNFKITVMDQCRMESATRTTMGEFYPFSTVPGITATYTGDGMPGQGPHAVSFSFTEGISDSALYKDNGDNTAQVNFCVLTGLYDGISLIDFAEVKLTYNIDLVTNIPSLTGYTVTQAEAFNDAEDTAIAFDGTLEAYFCNATTKEILTNDGSDKKTHQGSILNVCFKVPDGQFEVADVIDFTVTNALDTTPTQPIITNSAPASSLYSTKECTDSDTADTNICVVSFLLKADFYDFTALTLTGTGSVLLEFGDAAGTRRLRRKLKVDPVEESFQVTPESFEVDQVAGAASGASSAMASLAAFGAIAGAALAL